MRRRVRIKFLAKLLFAVAIIFAAGEVAWAIPAWRDYLEFRLKSRLINFGVNQFFPDTFDSLWGSTITALDILDDRHLAVGLTTDIAVFERESQTLQIRARRGLRGVVHQLTHRGEYLYAASGAKTLTSLRWSPPDRLDVRGEFCLPGYGLGLTLYNENKLLLTSSNGGVSQFTLNARGVPIFQRQLFGSRALFDSTMVGTFATNKVATDGRWVVASDALHGFIVADAADGTNVVVRSKAPEDFRPIAVECNDMEHAPWSTQFFKNYVYAAMFDGGFQIMVLEADGRLKPVRSVKPDSGFVRDLKVVDKQLLVPTEAGSVYAYDLEIDPTCSGPPSRIYSANGPIQFGTIVADDTGFFVANASTIFGFEYDNPAPVLRVRMDDEVRDIARVGEHTVVALGLGGLAIFDPSGDEWKLVSHGDFEGYIADILPIDDDHFFAVALAGGPFLVAVDSQDRMTRGAGFGTRGIFTLSADADETQFVVSGGVSGFLTYRRTDEGVEGPPKIQTATNGGYNPQIAIWAGHVWAPDITGPLVVDGRTDFWMQGERAPSRCISMSTSADRSEFTVKCTGHRVFRFAADDSERGFHAVQTMKVSKEVYSSLLSGTTLIVGEYPSGVSVYDVAGPKPRRIGHFDIDGIPYRLFPSESGILVAAGRGGVYELNVHDGDWTIRQVLATANERR